MNRREFFKATAATLAAVAVAPFIPKGRGWYDLQECWDYDIRYQAWLWTSIARVPRARGQIYYQRLIDADYPDAIPKPLMRFFREDRDYSFDRWVKEHV